MVLEQFRIKCKIAKYNNRNGTIYSIQYSCLSAYHPCRGGTIANCKEIPFAKWQCKY